MAKIKKIVLDALESEFDGIEVFHTTLTVKDLIFISYVAARGVEEEEGAVQRILNKKRVSSIKDFILQGNTFFNSFIINWVDSEEKPLYSKSKKKITVPIIKDSAQLIDGQHRLAGYEEAIKEDATLGDRKVLVSICTGLTTKDAARIFLNINSEQKPVPKSLIYDLFGEVEDDQDHAINRANDIANELNNNKESPYFNFIRFPGSPKGAPGIELSAVVGALKKHLEPEGTFSSHNLTNLDYQKMAIINFFTAIKSFYDTEGTWSTKSKNPFLVNAGFFGAIDALTEKLLTKCAEKRDFSVSSFKNLLDLKKSDLLHRKDLKSLEGKSQRKRVKEFLESQLLESLPEQDEFVF